MVGRIAKVDITDVWPHEALDFTRWLATDGLEHLADQLGLELFDAAIEQPMGEFRVDIVATDSEGRTVVVENQLRRTDHGHLGQIITYLAIAEAQAAVWISPDPRPEYIKRVEWLNEQTDADVWLVRVSAIRIGDSDPAPQFTVVAGPKISKRIKEVREEGGFNKRKQDLKAFWEAWLPVANNAVKDIPLPKPGYSAAYFSRRPWPGLPLTFHCWPRASDAYAEIRIQDESEEVNAAIFEACLARRVEIEADYGGPLVWDRLEGKSKDCKIDTQFIPIGSISVPSLEGMIELTEACNRLIGAFKPRAHALVAEGLANPAAQPAEFPAGM
jgi:hypothetical protein